MVLQRSRVTRFGVLLAFLTACGGGGDEGPITVPVLDDCTTLVSLPSLSIRAAGPWDFGAPSDEITIEVSQSRKAYFWPPVASECRDQVTAEWTVTDPRVASTLTDDALRQVWVTGLSPGTTRLDVTLRSGSGATRKAPSMNVQIVPSEPPPAGSMVLVEGVTALEPSPGDGVTPADSSRFVPFTTTFSGRLQIFLDWISPLNRISWVLTEGHCDRPGGCGTLLGVSHDDFTEPIEEDYSRLPPGRYTLRIDNIGPGHETLRYELRITRN